MPTLVENKTAGDWLQWEENGLYSRDAEQVGVTDSDISSGTVLGQVTDSEEFVVCDPTASDGSEVAAAINLNHIYPSETAQTSVLIKRHATVGRSGLTFGDGFTTSEQRDAAMVQLLGLGIKSA